jgi:positive regulator of sigma E activity
MQKIFHILVEATFWVLLVLSKLLLIFLILLIANSFLNINIYVWVIVSAIGLIYGVYFAEKIRKKHGCSNYWSKIYNTPDIDGKHNEE